MNIRKAFLLLALTACGVSAQSLLPLPRHFTPRAGRFVTHRPLRTVYTTRSVRHAVHQAGLDTDTLLRGTAKTGRAGVILYSPLTTTSENEAYRLDISTDTLRIAATTAAGFRYAAATLHQLAASGTFPCLSIDDAPAMAWRGAMIDVSRHFFSLEFLRRQIDVLAQFKINRLHLHLTDAAGWRMEIKRYPRLTSLAAWRTDSLWKTWWNGTRHYAEQRVSGAYGGYYTQRELRELVRYAAKRGITIVPEIEMPAHSEEVLTAYPELSCTHEPYRQADFCPGNEQTFTFLTNVLDEVMRTFPSKDIHIGGDEAGKASWPACPLCRKRMHDEGMSSTNDLQAYLIRRIGRYLERHGRRLIGWDEIIADTLPRHTTVMVWRDTAYVRRAVERGYDVILSPGRYCYLDGFQDDPTSQPEAMGGYTPLRRVYSYAPLSGLSPSERSHIRGIQGNLWTEYVPTEQHAEYMLYPRLLALAEIGWHGAPPTVYDDFHRRAVAATDGLRSRGVNAFDLSRETGDRPERDTPVQHLARGARVIYHLPYHSAYPAAGAGALTDGRRGGWDYGATSAWQGFIGGDRFDVTIALDSVTTIRSIAVNFLENAGPGILLPADMRISVSTDGENYAVLFRREQPVEPHVTPRVEQWGWRGETRARFIRLRARSGQLGGWIFADEVEVH